MPLPLHRFAVVGGTGRTGTAVVERLLEAGSAVRLITREGAVPERWAGADVTARAADVGDAAALAKAFAGVEGAYVMNPPAYHEADIFARARDVASATVDAALKAKVPFLAVLSALGAQLPDGTGSIVTNAIFEHVVEASEIPSVFVRAAFLIENYTPNVPTVVNGGVLTSFLQPLDRPIAMVAARDAGRVAAEALLDGETGVIELIGPREYSPHDVATAFARALQKGVRPATIPESAWIKVLTSFGFPPRTAAAFAEMYRAVIAGTITFEFGPERRLRGTTSLESAVATLLEHQIGS